MKGGVRWLFLDLNSYFASVEQQETPSLRGRPVAVTPTLADSGCCIAASYEAKAFSVRTGMRVAEARTLCPGLQIVESRPALYVRYHHRIFEAVDSCVPVEATLSIDEMACRLTGSQEEPSKAVLLAGLIKKTIAERAGPCLKSSIGIAPNRFLAKLASDVKKPDGLTVLTTGDLPDALLSLPLQGLPGIGPRMDARLRREGIRSFQNLWDLDSRNLKRIWGGVNGERFWRLLRGEDLEERPVRRRSISHSHVLEPALRTREGGFRIAQKLASKLGVRLRKMGYHAGGLSVAVQFVNGPGAEARAPLDEIRDTPTLLKTFKDLWEGLPSRSPLWVGVTLYSLIPEERTTPSLFDDGRKDAMSFLIDKLNDTYGHDTAYFASLHHVKNKAPTRIPFTRVPEDWEMGN